MANVKICGLTNETDLRHAISAGANYVGLVHFPKSPRHVDLATAASLAKIARQFPDTRSVVLLVNPDDELVDLVAREVAPDIIQLHGTEPPDRVAEIGNLALRPIMKALAIAEKEDVAQAFDYLMPGCADMILFDAKPPPNAELPGGNGLSFDWTILEGVAGEFPFTLAGGLTPDNVAEAIQLTKAAVVDVSSGVEAEPGKKDPRLVERFIAESKRVGQTDA